METANKNSHTYKPMSLPLKLRRIRSPRRKSGAILLVATLIVSVVIMTQQSTEATIISDLCETYPITCPDSPPPSTTSSKMFLAMLLQYVNLDTQVNIYKSNMGSEDQARLRVVNGDELRSEYVQATKNLPGPAGVTFMSSNEVVQNSKRVKDLGFSFIELNLESGLSPDTDTSNVVGAFKKAAQASHEAGLKFRATVTRADTEKHGPQIAPFVDYFHIQTQSLQDNGIRQYSDWVDSQIAKLKNAKPGLKVTVLVSTEAGNAPGLTKLETLKQCVASVMDDADGAGIWFSKSNIQTMKSFVQWFNDRY